MVHDVHEPSGAHDLCHPRGELRATLRGRCLGKVDYLKIRPFHYQSDSGNLSTIWSETGPNITHGIGWWVAQERSEEPGATWLQA